MKTMSKKLLCGVLSLFILMGGASSYAAENQETTSPVAVEGVSATSSAPSESGNTEEAAIDDQAQTSAAAAELGQAFMAYWNVVGGAISKLPTNLTALDAMSRGKDAKKVKAMKKKQRDAFVSARLKEVKSYKTKVTQLQKELKDLGNEENVGILIEALETWKATNDTSEPGIEFAKKLEIMIAGIQKNGVEHYYFGKLFKSTYTSLNGVEKALSTMKTNPDLAYKQIAKAMKPVLDMEKVDASQMSEGMKVLSGL